MSLRVRVALSVTLFVALAFVAAAWMIDALFRRTIEQDFDTTLRAAVAAVASHVGSDTDENEIQSVPEDIAEIIVPLEGRIGRLQVIVFDSVKRPLLTYGLRDTTLIAQIPPWDDGVGLVHMNGKDLKIAVCPYEVREQRAGTVLIATSTERMDVAVQGMRSVLFTIVPLTVLLVGTGSWMISRRTLRSLSILTSEVDARNPDTSLAPISVECKDHEVRDLRRAFNSLIQKVNALLQTQQSFIMDASHELKTPLTVIQTELEILEMKAGLGREAKESLHVLLSETAYAGKIAADLLYLTRLEGGMSRQSRADVDQVVAETVEHLVVLAKKNGVILQLELGARQEVMADVQQLKRAILNVVENAILYTRKGGTVLVSTSCAHGACVLAVKDSGLGIRAEELPLVFDRFYRTKEARAGGVKGSGLGLSIARRIVEFHNGSISIESQRARGTEVVITLPS